MRMMHKIAVWGMVVAILSGAATASAADDTLKPYILAGVRSGPVSAVKTQVEQRLTEIGFEVVGAYAPMGDESISIICLTSPALKQAASQAGGLLGFAAVIRVGLLAVDDKVEVSFMNPPYWGNAYYRDAYADVESTYKVVDDSLRKALAAGNAQAFKPYGSKKGLSASKLRKYHYMMAMPYFDDVVTLADETEYSQVTKTIESAVQEEDSQASIVYKIKFPDQSMALYGIALGGERGENRFLPKIDSHQPRHITFLPYEMLVLPDRVVMLHGKYRIALSFPDLSMGTFMKISSTPGDIADSMRRLTTAK